MLAYIALLAGCLLLYKGGNWLLEGVIDFGTRMNWPKAITGLLLVSLGTSAPELFVSLGAAVQGQGAIAAGNVIGSNIINLAIVLGIAAGVSALLVERVLQGQLKALILISVMAAITLMDGLVTRLEGLLLLASITISFFYAFKSEHTGSAIIDSSNSNDNSARTIAHSTRLTVGGIVTLVLGAEAMIWGGLALAQQLQIPTAIVALTVTAFGTSLPEIAATVVAVSKRETSLAVGNVIGSNMLNLGLVLGLSALTVPLDQINIDLLSNGFFLGLTAFITIMGLGFKRIPRIAGVALLVSYAAYAVLLTL